MARNLNKGEKTILLVEDDEVNREIISEILVDMGYTVFDKRDVTSALNIVKRTFLLISSLPTITCLIQMASHLWTL